MSKAKEQFGRSMLEKMGWSEGTGLGAKRNGIVEPISVKSRPEKVGVGATRPQNEDPWWEKILVEAYGKGIKDVGDRKLLDACEGRRCRPHGTAKLARIARQDAKMTAQHSEKPDRTTAIVDSNEDSVDKAVGKHLRRERKKSKRKMHGVADAHIRKTSSKRRKHEKNRS